MPNWTATLTSAAKDSSGQNANLNITVTFSNSVTNEVQTRTWPGSNWTVASLKAMAEQVIASLNQRDTALALANTAISAGGANVVLATG